MRVTSKNTGSDYLNVARKGGHHKGWFLGALPSVHQVSFTLLLSTSDTTLGSLRATSSFGGCREKYTRERHARRDAFSRGLLRSSKFPTPETIREIGTSFRQCAMISGIIWVDKRYLWLVHGFLEYHRPIITIACPPKRSQVKSLRRKLVPISLMASRVGNRRACSQTVPFVLFFSFSNILFSAFM